MNRFGLDVFWRLIRSGLWGGRVRLILSTVLLSELPAAHVHAQCMEWSPVFDQAHSAVRPIYTMHVHDDGTGPALFVGGDVISIAGVVTRKVGKFQNGTWSALGTGLHPGSLVDCYVNALESFDSGSGSMLYAGGLFMSPATALARWNGTSWSALDPPLFPPDVTVSPQFEPVVYALEVFDDGTGSALYVAGESLSTTGLDYGPRVLRWNGTSWSGLPGALNGRLYTMRTWDDGTGPALYVGGSFTSVGGVTGTNHIAKWDGTNWSPVGIGLPGGVVDIEIFDDGGGPTLFVSGPSPGVFRWNGSGWSSVGAGTISISWALEVFDDGSGPALYATGSYQPGGPPPGPVMAKWDGQQWSPLGGGLSFPTQPGEAFTLAVYDDGQGGGPDLMVGGWFTYAGSNYSGLIAAWRGCGSAVDSICSGSGTLRACPCSNNGSPGNGCGWSGNAGGAHLTYGGATNPDTLFLQAWSMPQTSTTLFLKGDQVASDGILYGDGLRCVSGNLIRLGVKVNAGGAALYPEAGDAQISVRGGTPPGSGAVGYYQAAYRNAVPFCAAESFNITNGLRVVW